MDDNTFDRAVTSLETGEALSQEEVDRMNGVAPANFAAATVRDVDAEQSDGCALAAAAAGHADQLVNAKLQRYGQLNDLIAFNRAAEQDVPDAWIRERTGLYLDLSIAGVEFGGEE